MTKKPKILINAIQRADKTVGGMAYRYAILWKYLYYKKNQDIYLITTTSMIKKFNLDDKNKNIFIINDQNEFSYKLSMLLISLIIIYISTYNKISNIHLATSGYNYIPLFYLATIFNKKVSLTFASNSIEMAAYNNPKAYRVWDRVLRHAKNIDILNPTHKLDGYKFKKFISPCSFPHILYSDKLSNYSFEDKNRENYIIFCGAFEETKNPFLALDSFEIFLNKNINNKSKLIMFGKGSLLNKIENRINEINIKFGQVIILENFNTYFDYLNKSKIFLSLQDYDNYPSQSLMEAMLFCNFIIATNYGDTKKLVDSTENNIISIKDPQLVADAIESIFSKNSISLFNRNKILNEHNIEIFSKYFNSMQNEIATKN